MTFLNALHERPITPEERKLLRLFVIIWDNGAFHHSHLVKEWFAVHPCLMMQLLPAYSPFLNLQCLEVEVLWSPSLWVDALAGCNDCHCRGAEECQGWIRHARRFLPLCSINSSYFLYCNSLLLLLFLQYLQYLSFQQQVEKVMESIKLNQSKMSTT